MESLDRFNWPLQDPASSLRDASKYLHLCGRVRESLSVKKGVRTSSWSPIDSVAAKQDTKEHWVRYVGRMCEQQCSLCGLYCRHGDCGTLIRKSRPHIEPEWHSDSCRRSAMRSLDGNWLKKRQRQRGWVFRCVWCRHWRQHTSKACLDRFRGFRERNDVSLWQQAAKECCTVRLNGSSFSQM